MKITCDELVLNNIAFAEKIACKRMKSLPFFIDLEELKSAAYYGLVEAAKRFNPSIGIKFTTYAYPRIFGSIQDYLRSQSWFGRNSDLNMVSIDDDKDELSLKDCLEAKCEDRSSELLSELSSCLDEQSKFVLHNYFIEDNSMKEIGNKLGVSEARVSQIIKNSKRQINKNWSKELFLSMAA